VVGWNESSGNVSAVTDSAGASGQLPAATARSNGPSQAVYYGMAIAAAAVAANTVTVKLDEAVNHVDIRNLEGGGLDRTNRSTVSSAAARSTASATSRAATTSFASEILRALGPPAICSPVPAAAIRRVSSRARRRTSPRTGW